MGPLSGRRVVELAGIGPAPFAAMLLADMGADVVRVDRPEAPSSRLVDPRFDVLTRNRRSVAVDLKSPRGIAAVLELVATADALVEGFRPGVTERLGLGPDVCLARNPRLVYGRMTGWGQDGPMARVAGHDINYIALAGALAAIGPADGAPVPPLNLLGDFGGGGMLLGFGVVCGMLQATSTGTGQVVDAAMVDGTALLMSLIHGLMAQGLWSERRGTNLLDGGAPFYGVYETADGRWVSVGALEPQFYLELLHRLGLDAAALPAQADPSGWPRLREAIAAAVRLRTADELAAALEGTDACFAPVLTTAEAAAHPHNRARGTFVEVDGVVQAAPAPRFGRTPAELRRPPCRPGEHSREVLLEWGVAAADVDDLVATGVVTQARMSGAA